MKQDAVITSSQNQWIKKAALLKQKKYRQSEGTFLLEGMRLVEEFVRSDWLGLFGFYADPLPERGEVLLQELMKKGIKLYPTTPELLRRISDTEEPQGLVVVAKQKHYTLEQVHTDNPLLVVLDGLQDPGNVGTLIRTCDAAGVSGVILSQAADLYNSKTIRASMGSIFHIPIVEVAQPQAVLSALQAQHLKVYVTSLGPDSTLYDQVDYGQSCALVFGSEGHGVSRPWLDVAEAKVHIPIYGQAESLNVAVSGGILVYEAIRQRRATCQKT